MDITRRNVLGASALCTLLHPGLHAFAQSGWPTRPVRLICPYAAGGASDISLRIQAEQLGRSLNQQFIVENKPGAGTRLAIETTTRAEPDGYTFLYVAAPYATAEALYGKQNYERKDLRPVAMAVAAPLFLIVNAQSPFTNVQDLIAYGKSQPNGLTFGSPGAGSQPHLAAELLFRDAGVKGLNVPFRGDAPAYTELLAGRVDATLTAISSALPHIEAGKLRVLGVASADRSAIHPTTLTLREQGLPSVIASGWYGFMAPRAESDAIIDRLQTEINNALGQQDVKQKLLAQGLEARSATASAFGKFIDDETQKWGRLIREAGLKGEQ